MAEYLILIPVVEMELMVTVMISLSSLTPVTMGVVMTVVEVVEEEVLRM